MNAATSNVPFELLYNNGLTFEALRRANLARCPLFKNAKGETLHSGRDWSEEDWLVAVLGELGEAANVLKKIRRHDLSMDEAREKLAREFSDMVIYLDLLAAECEVNFESEDPTWKDSFSNMRNTTRFASRVLDYTPNYLMVETFKRLSGAILIMQQVGNVAVFKRESLLASSLRSVLYCIDALADKCGIDLGDAVKKTFNAKSAQLELPLFLTNYGPITEPPDALK